MGHHTRGPHAAVGGAAYAYFSALQTRPGCRSITTDTCVPISRLAESINESVREADAAGLPYFIVGHVGDGNFHLAYLLDPAKPEERETAERLSQQMVARALRLGAPAPASTASACTSRDFWWMKPARRPWP